MHTQIHAADMRVLVLGDPEGARRRADALRLRGIAAWPVGGDESLSWLLGEASVDPSVALVVLPQQPGPRAARIRQAIRMLAHTRLPAVVIGAEGEQLALFGTSIVELPTNVDIETIAEAVSALHFTGDQAVAATGS